MQNLLPFQHLHAITWAGAHATHKAAQTYRDAVEGPSLRPRRTVLLISHTHIAPGKSAARTSCGYHALHVHKRYYTYGSCSSHSDTILIHYELIRTLHYATSRVHSRTIRPQSTHDRLCNSGSITSTSRLRLVISSTLGGSETPV